MITNKDGSYNKFRILIISLIFIIAIFITGFYILQNIELPKIESPSWTTPTPTPTPIPTIIIDPSIETLYSNTSNITYNNFTFNWTYSNYTNTTNWTLPLIKDNSTLITYSAGGGGGSSGYTNISYTVVAGGGGSGGMGYTGIINTNSTYAANITPTTTEPTPEITYNLSQNISAVIGQPLAPLGITNPLLVMILLGLPLVLLFSNRSVSSVFPIIFGLVVIGMFLKLEFWSIVAMVMLIPFLIIIFSDR